MAIDLKFIYALILTVMPVTELRVGLPLAISYAVEQNVPIVLVFLIVVLLNILVIFFIFFFLDNLHHLFYRFKPYKKFFDFYIRRLRKRIDKFEKKFGNATGFLALVLFVAVPLPGTGAWTGCLISFVLGLERKKSVLSIALGVIIAGLLILLGSLGFILVF